MNADVPVRTIRLPRTESPADAFDGARVPPIVAWRLELRLFRSAEPLCAMEYDRDTARAFWLSATVDEILLVVVPGLTKDETFEIRNRLMEIGDPHRVDLLCRVCTAVTGRPFAERA